MLEHGGQRVEPLRGEPHFGEELACVAARDMTRGGGGAAGGGGGSANEHDGGASRRRCRRRGGRAGSPKSRRRRRRACPQTATPGSGRPCQLPHPAGGGGGGETMAVRRRGRNCGPTRRPTTCRSTLRRAAAPASAPAPPARRRACAPPSPRSETPREALRESCGRWAAPPPQHKVQPHLANVPARRTSPTMCNSLPYVKVMTPSPPGSRCEPTGAFTTARPPTTTRLADRRRRELLQDFSVEDGNER